MDGRLHWCSNGRRFIYMFVKHAVVVRLIWGRINVGLIVSVFGGTFYWYNKNVLVLCRVMWYVGRCIMGCRWWLGWSVSFGLVTASPCGACCFGRRMLGRLCWSWIGRGGWRRSRGCWGIIVIVIIIVVLIPKVVVTCLYDWMYWFIVLIIKWFIIY